MVLTEFHPVGKMPHYLGFNRLLRLQWSSLRPCQSFLLLPGAKIFGVFRKPNACSIVRACLPISRKRSRLPFNAPISPSANLPGFFKANRLAENHPFPLMHRWDVTPRPGGKKPTPYHSSGHAMSPPFPHPAVATTPATASGRWPSSFNRVFPRLAVATHLPSSRSCRNAGFNRVFPRLAVATNPAGFRSTREQVSIGSFPV